MASSTLNEAATKKEKENIFESINWKNLESKYEQLRELKNQTQRYERMKQKIKSTISAIQEYTNMIKEFEEEKDNLNNQLKNIEQEFVEATKDYNEIQNIIKTVKNEKQSSEKNLNDKLFKEYNVIKDDLDGFRKSLGLKRLLNIQEEMDEDNRVLLKRRRQEITEGNSVSTSALSQAWLPKYKKNKGRNKRVRKK